MSLKDYIPGRHRLYGWMFEKGMAAILGDGDVVCLIPFADGLMARKRGYYEKNLVGNYAGYETSDGDLFIMDGEGDPVFHLAGVPVVLCVDPSEMAAVIHPIKALLGQKQAIGEYVRVDRQDNVVSRGKALEPTADTEHDPPVASESPVEFNEAVHDELVDFSPKVRAAVGEPGDAADAALADGGEVATPQIPDAKAAEVVERATGYVVSANKAARTVPDQVTAKELKIMQQRERNAARDTGQMLKMVGYGAVIGCVATLLGTGVYAAAAGLL